MATYTNQILVFSANGAATKTSNLDILVQAGGIQNTPVGAANPSTGGFTTLASTGLATLASLSVTGDAIVGGNLDVTGTIISRDEERVLVQDNFLDVNFGYVTNTALAGGVAVNFKAEAGGLSIDASAANLTFAAQAGATNPKVTGTAGQLPDNTFAVNDIIQIAGTSAAENDGFYVVQAEAAGEISIMDVNDTINAKFAQNNFTSEADASNPITLTQVNVTTIQVNAAGAWVTYTGKTNGEFAGAGSDLGSSSLQEAYDEGATITTDASGDITFVLSADDQGFSVNGSSAGNGDVEIGATTAVNSFVVNASGAASSITATGQILSLATTGANELDITSGGALDLNGAAVTIDGSAGVDITAANGQVLSVNGGDGTAKFLISAAGQVDVTGESAQTVNIGSTAAALNLTTTTSGNVEVGSAASVIIDSAAAAESVALQVASASFLSLNGSTSAVDVKRPLVLASKSIVQTAPLQAIMATLTAGEALAVGEVVYYSAAGAVSKADCNAGSIGDAIRFPVGVAQAAIGNGTDGSIGIGGIATIKLDVTNAGNVGKPVFLDDGAGQGTQTAPTAGTVYRLGILHAAADGNGLALVNWSPAFGADIS